MSYFIPKSIDALYAIEYPSILRLYAPPKLVLSKQLFQVERAWVFNFVKLFKKTIRQKTM